MLTAGIEIESNNSTTILDVAVADPAGMQCDANYIQEPPFIKLINYQQRYPMVIIDLLHCSKV